MKKILFMILMTISSVYAKPCMTDIYFGNGVWNTEEQAIEGKTELRKFLLLGSNAKLDINKEGIDYDFKHAYNKTTGTNTDLIETFWQLKESGQISKGYFDMIAATLATKDGASSHQEIMAQIHNIIAYYNFNMTIMFELYKTSSFKQKHNVLLVAHSQGNLFGNKMYTLMNEEKKKKFRMVSVATPASTALGNLYVTATNDYVIGPILNSLPGNVAGTGHTFLGTYLNMYEAGVIGDGSDTAPIVIGEHIITAYNNLVQTTSCTEYDYVHVQIKGVDSVSVLGNVAGTNQYYETIETFPISTYSTFPNGGICGSGYFPLGWPDIFETVYNEINTYRWHTGTISSLSELESRKESVVKYFDSGICVTIPLNGDLYEVIKNTFDG